jgi:hypothetical protein
VVWWYENLVHPSCGKVMPVSYLAQALSMCVYLDLYDKNISIPNSSTWTYTSGLYYKHITVLNDDSSIISNWCSKLWHHLLIDDARVVIYDGNMFIIQATGVPLHLWVNCHLVVWHLVDWHGAKKLSQTSKCIKTLILTKTV